jgi:hypothetical protein
MSNNDLQPFFTNAEACENCGRPCDAGTLTWVPGFNYWGCDDCVAEAAIAVFAEETCPSLYDFFLKARSVSEVQKAYQEHRATCPNCMNVEKKVAKFEREFPKEWAA